MYDIYQYLPDVTDFNLTLRSREASQRHYLLRFQSARAARPKHRYATADLCIPNRPGPKPLAILVHGAGDFSLAPLVRAGAALAKGGIAAVTLRMVFNSRRQSPEIRKRYPFLSDAEWREFYVTSVTEIRQLLDWAAIHPEIDADRVALVGISLGGFIGAIAMGLDRRLGVGMLALMGGNSEKLVRHSRHVTVRRTERLSKAEFAVKQGRYAAYLERVAAAGFAQVAPDEPYYLTDPLTFAPQLRDRRLLMVGARWDEIVPREGTLEFWRAAGTPPLHWLPITHLGFWLATPWINRRVARFLRAELLGQPD